MADFKFECNKSYKSFRNGSVHKVIATGPDCVVFTSIDPEKPYFIISPRVYPNVIDGTNEPRTLEEDMTPFETETQNCH